jgi:hypothetical protein
MKTVDPGAPVAALCAALRHAAPGGIRPAFEVLDLLSVVREALDVPLPAPGADNERAYQALMERRTTFARCALGSVLEPSSMHRGKRVLSRQDAAWLRRHVANTPVTYCAYEPETAPVSA